MGACRRISMVLTVTVAGGLGSACSARGFADKAADSGDETPSDAGAQDSATDDVGPTYAPTYSAVYNEILSPSCAISFCHGSDADYLQLSSEPGGYASLIGAPAQGPLCADAGLKRVDPGHPETSLLYLKITSPPCGSKMPRGYTAGLAPRQIAQIKTWIALGAMDD